MGEKPFLSFYGDAEIAPVHQNFDDVSEHFVTRKALYNQIGLPDLVFRGSSVLEIGPGTGQNALFILENAPAQFTLVDGNAKSIEATKANLAAHKLCHITKIIEVDAAKKPAFGNFDVVLCEGVIPFQLDPKSFATAVGQNVATQGIFVLTTIDAISFVGETLRRLIAYKIINTKFDYKERLPVLCDVFQSHLSKLPGKTRSVEDWVYDNILIPYVGKLFSIADAIEALNSDFELHGSSPSVFTDWRWYKSIPKDMVTKNQRVRDQYLASAVSFLDYRSEPVLCDKTVTEDILVACQQMFDHMVELERTHAKEHMAECINRLNTLYLSDPVQPVTKKSLGACLEFLNSDNLDPDLSLLEDFEGFFGRGQQYVSFRKK